MHTLTCRKRLNSEEESFDISLDNKRAKIMENFSALTPKNGLTPKPAGGGAKKLVIKNLKVKPTLPDNFQVYSGSLYDFVNLCKNLSKFVYLPLRCNKSVQFDEFFQSAFLTPAMYTNQTDQF